MTSLSDTLTVGLVLVLLFGSIALYFYTRIQQAEQKISLLESILLDLKMSMEVKSYTSLPAEEEEVLHQGGSTVHQDEYRPFSDETEHLETVMDAMKPPSPAPSVSSKSEEEVADEKADAESEVEQYKSVIAEAVKEEETVVPSASKISVNYESMTLKELQALAKSRGIMGASSMKKNPIIEALKTSDKVLANTPVESGSLSAVGTGTFLETSAPFLGSESQ